MTLLVLVSCSVSTEFFIQNLTSSKQTVTINFRKNKSADPDTVYDVHLDFKYENRISTPKEFSKSKRLITLEKTIVNDRITIDIPAHAMLKIEKSDHFDWKSNVKSIEINDKQYSIEQLYHKAQKIKYNYIYKIE
ncbi:hypothetical protein CHA01nite_30350 [Chryseobacterium hagamense]|uniref:Uncharacterized protein n=2 Tax=Chryseobacterium hagamense TaxID=395935 RepID=A0A511YQ28_9FLAO|nr:hypothetical protein CHA01nite_30350 [Chryseobacterium hagamense]